MIKASLSIKCLPIITLAMVSSDLRGDLVSEWNQAILNTIRSSSVNPPMATRSMAILHTSIYDAMNSADRRHQGFHVKTNAASASNAEAAGIAAAYQVMSTLYPSLEAQYAGLRDSQLAGLGGGSEVTNGLNLGVSVANTVLAWRASDGAAEAASTPYTTTPLPGYWQPTAPGFAPALLPGFGNVTPWAIPNTTDFLPAGPTPLNSVDWVLEYNFVKDIGAIDSPLRTADQTEIARFWADGAGTYTPPGHWNAIAQGFTGGMSTHESARMFAMLNVALADAAIVAWDSKYIDDFWRPITAIRNGETDGNAATIADPNWTPLIVTPPFPEYVSGHSSFSGAASGILAGLFGDDVNFSTQGDTDFDGIFDTTRSYQSFIVAAEEAGMSRIYGGIHFMSGNLDGLELGADIADYVLSTFFQPIPEPSGIILLVLGATLTGLRRKRSPVSFS